MVDLDDMRMFRALDTTHSLAGAARLLDVTPPALTVRLQKLEERLGVHLAVREGHEALYIEKIAGRRAARVVTRRGGRLPLLELYSRGVHLHFGRAMARAVMPAICSGRGP